MRHKLASTNTASYNWVLCYPCKSDLIATIFIYRIHGPTITLNWNCVRVNGFNSPLRAFSHFLPKFHRLINFRTMHNNIRLHWFTVFFYLYAKSFIFIYFWCIKRCKNFNLKEEFAAKNQTMQKLPTHYSRLPECERNF